MSLISCFFLEIASALALMVAVVLGTIDGCLTFFAEEMRLLLLA